MKNLAIAFLLLFVAKVNAQQIFISNKSSSSSTNSVEAHAETTTTTKESTFSWASTTKKSTQGLENENEIADAEKGKFYSKTYVIDKNDKVGLSNKFGSITIIVWNKNEIKIDAEIKAYANTDAQAQELIDEVEVTANKEANLISFTTNIENSNGNWGRGSRNGKNWRREVKVNVTVYMPAGNALSAKQQYGNIQMEDFSGPTSIKVQYGNFTANNLKSNNNYINVQYGKCVINEAAQVKINHQYGGGLTIGTVGELELLAQYINVNIGEIKQASTLKQQYGSGISIGSAAALTATVQYSTLKIANLQGNLTSKIQYGKINIDEVKADCRAIAIDADYTDVTLGFAANYNADFEVNTNYGSFKYEGNVSAKKQTDDDRHYSAAKNYLGTVARGGANTIVIKANYGGVTFK